MSFYEYGEFRVYVVRKEKPTPTSVDDFILYNDYFDECTIHGGISSLGDLSATFSGRTTSPSPKGDSGTLGSDLTEGNFIYILCSDVCAIKARVIKATFSLEGKITIEAIQSCGLRQGISLDKDEYGGSEFTNEELSDIFTSTTWNVRGLVVDDTNSEIVHTNIADSSRQFSMSISAQNRISAVIEVLKNNGYEWSMWHGFAMSPVPFSAGDTLKTSSGLNIQSPGTVLGELILSGENANCMPSKNSEQDETVVNDVIIKAFDKKNTPFTSNIYHSTDTHRTTILYDLDGFLKTAMPPFKDSNAASKVCELVGADSDNFFTNGRTYLFKINNEYMVGEYSSSVVSFINVSRGQKYTTTNDSLISVCKNSYRHAAGSEVIVLADFDIFGATLNPGVYAREIPVESMDEFAIGDYVYIGGEKVLIINRMDTTPPKLAIQRSIFPDDPKPDLTYNSKYSDQIYAHTKDMYLWDATYTKYNPESSPDTNSILRNGLQTKVYYAKSNFTKDELDKLAIRILDSLDNNVSNYILEVPEACNEILNYLVGMKVNVSEGAFLGISDGTYRIINTSIKLPENILSLELANEDYRTYAEDSSHFNSVQERTGNPYELLLGFSAKHVRDEGESSQIAGKPIFKWKNDGECKFSINYANSEDAWDYFGTPTTDREFEEYDSEIATVGYVKAATGGSGPGGLWTEETTNLYPYTDRNILPFTTDISTIGSETRKWLSVNALTSNSYTVNTEEIVGQAGSDNGLLIKTSGSFGMIGFSISDDPIAFINSSGFTLGQGVLWLSYESGIVGNQKIIFGKNSDYSDNCSIRVNSTSGNLEYSNDSGVTWQEFNSNEERWQDLGTQSIETRDDKLIKITYFDDSSMSPSDSYVGLMYQNEDTIKFRSSSGWIDVLSQGKWQDLGTQSVETKDDRLIKITYFDDSSMSPSDSDIGLMYQNGDTLKFRSSSGWVSLDSYWDLDSVNVSLAYDRNLIPNTTGNSLGGTIANEIWENVNYYGLSNSRTSSGTLVGSIGADSTDAYWQINGILGIKLNWAQSGTGTADRQLWFLGDSIYPNTNNTVNLGAPTRYFENTYTTLLNSNEVDSVFGEFLGSGSTPALKAGEYSSGDFNLEVTTSTFRLYNSMLDFHYDNPFKQIQFSTSSFGTYSAIRANPYTNVLEFTNDGSTWEAIESAGAPLWQYTSSGVQPALSGRHIVPNGSGSDIGRQYSGESWRDIYAYNTINLCNSFTSPYSLLSMTHSGNTSNLISAYDFNLWWQFYGSSATDRRLVFSGDTIRPYVDNSVNLGSNAYKFLSISASVINLNGVYRSSWPTSDWVGTATSNLNMGSWGIYLGGVYRTSWPSAGMSNPATADLNMNAYDIDDVDFITGTTGYSYLRLGSNMYVESDQDMYISSIGGPMDIDCHSTLTVKWTQHSSSADDYRLFFQYGTIYPAYSFGSCYGTVSLGKSTNRFDYSYFYGLAAQWFDTSSCDVAELQFVADDVNVGDIVELGEWDSEEEIEFEKEVAHNDETCEFCGNSYLGMQGKWKKAAKRSKKCPSIVSTEPGMLLGGSENRKKLYASGKMKPIALKGSVPMVYIEGSFESGDILVSAGNGHAMVDNDANWNEVVAYAKRSGENERCEVWIK